jgi:hypothetical protein
MADFSTFSLAEARCVAKTADGTWLEAHSARATIGGKIVVRVIRKMSPTHPDYGAWTEINDDAVV